MKKDWDLTQEAFDALLNWLDTDREQAALEYLRIRGKLIRIFLGRGCPAAEELADEAINRVTVRVPELADYQGDKALYFYRAAHFVYLEWVKKQKRMEDQTNILVDHSESRDEEELKDRCLQRCLAELPEDKQTLFLEFNRQEKRAKIEHRKTMANEQGITINALRIKVHRIRQQLKQCMTKCLEELPAH